ncbi:hypothetical protein JAO78_013685 [Alishewanella sp. 16-MA]|uniref:Uncharacterized protein n=1 Tax=Alishewanella maricola TaxID=2795740 RepID=A0ABS8C693_9ALTE|nr:hypothetical protein [Alishewanella maricola]MCB5227864.1 hypothetical protein [Alishewanella maricola]
MPKLSWLIRFSGPYLSLLALLIGGLLLLSINRLGLVFWQYQRVLATGELSQILLQGVSA